MQVVLNSKRRQLKARDGDIQNGINERAEKRHNFELLSSLRTA